jgi:hypothetical protein
MSNYECNECRKKFSTKKNLDYHTKNKICHRKKVYCMYCESLFFSKNSMSQHLQFDCKIKKDDDKEKAEIYEKIAKLKIENKELKIEYKELKIEYEELKNEMKVLKKQMNNKTKIL